jgi:nucleoside-diphosphate-sugar epimerase
VIRNSKILITGAAGFIGFHLSKFLASEPSNIVWMLDNFARGERDKDLEELLSFSNVKFLEIDLSIDELDLPSVDYVFHLASINGTENFYSRPFEVVEAAILPTLRILRFYKGSNVGRFLLTSTSEVYAGAIETGLSQIPTPETTPLVINDPRNMRWSYAAGKIAAEMATLAAAKQYGLPATIIRFHNVYGPRMGNQHVIPEFIDRIKKSDFRLFGAENTRSFIYIADAVAATAAAATTDTLGEIVHIGTEDEVTIEKLAQEIMLISGIDGSLQKHKAPEGSVSRRCPDTTVLKQVVGFSPKITLREGLTLTIAHYAITSTKSET